MNISPGIARELFSRSIRDFGACNLSRYAVGQGEYFSEKEEVSKEVCDPRAALDVFLDLAEDGDEVPDRRISLKINKGDATMKFTNDQASTETKLELWRNVKIGPQPSDLQESLSKTQKVEDLHTYSNFKCYVVDENGKMKIIDEEWKRFQDYE